jgi:poly(A) polymerase
VLTRYSKNSKGKLIKQANIYLKEEHGLSLTAFDDEAVALCKQLIRAGGAKTEAYIVGGAIRDLLLGRSPKDWDIVTNEPPLRIRKFFKRSRIIGKRFKLVHVESSRGSIFEVATFRSLMSGEDELLFGTLEEDAFRRDFTLNALYYDVVNEQIIDFHGGYEHIKAGVIHPVVPLKHTFIEDPVRMVRAIKSAHISQATLAPALAKTIKKQAKLLADSSKSRLSEELLKVLALAEGRAFLQQCYDMRLLGYWIPAYDDYIRSLTKPEMSQFWHNLDHPVLPKTKRFKENSQRHKLLYAMLYPYLKSKGDIAKMSSETLVSTLKEILFPVVLPNKEIFMVIKMIIAKEGLPSSFFKEQDYLQRKRIKRELQQETLLSEQ